MSVLSAFKSCSKEWIETLERAARREECIKGYYEREYSDLMTYDRFKFINHLQLRLNLDEIDEHYAMGLIRKYDKDHEEKNLND